MNDYESYGFSCVAEGAPSDYIGLDAPEIVTVGLSKTDLGLNIHRKITTVNRTKLSNKSNLYIVIHYVGAVSTAANNASYFYSVNRSASASYFVDENEIWQVVEDYDAAWHCGGGLQSNRGGTFYKKCTNSNSIGIEMCMKVNCNGEAYFEEKTVENTIDLTKTLMRKYNIPIERVIRHFDVVGKYCPAPYVDENAWSEFKEKLQEKNDHWAKEYFDYLKNKGLISNPEIWTDYDGYLTKSEAIALLDKTTGGIWCSDEADSSIHWVQPHVISMTGKGYLDPATINEIWLTYPDALISKAQTLALLDNITGGTLPKYKDAIVDHWGRRNLDSLCDKAIIDTPDAWDDDFEAPATRGIFMALLVKCIESNKIV